MWNTIRIPFLLLFIVSLPVTLCNDDVRVSINPNKRNIDKPAGQSFVATCHGEAEDPKLFTDMRWTGLNGDISEDVSEPVYIIKEKVNSVFLQFNAPTPDLSGSYTCTAVYDNTLHRNDTVHITFYHAITFEDCPEVQALVIATTGKIRCSANANPPASIYWSKGNLNLEDNRFQIGNDGVTVTDVRETDAGTYRMRALVQQTGELKVKFISLEVQVPPEITELKEEVEVVEGTRIELTCRASGNPPPKYYWLDPIQRNLSSVDGFIVDSNTGTLTIRDVRKENKGMYRCQASNGAAKTEKTMELTVLVKPEIRQFNNVTRAQERDTTMECRAYGEPPPDMSIRRDGQNEPLASGDDRIRIKRYLEGEESVLMLTIQRTLKTDDGLYYCAATNKGGHAERVGHLTVEFAPDMSSTPATERKTWNDNPVNLTCVAEAIPNATITWYFRNQEVGSNDIYKIYGTTSHSSLLVRPRPGLPGGSDIFGRYRCEGRNQYGNASIEINLQEARVPGRIQQITFDKLTATTVTFHLRGLIDDGGLPITSYVVKYYEDGPSRDQTRTYEWPEGTSYILEKLKPRTKYYFRFAAKNDAGVGEFSEEHNMITPAESAPEPPILLSPGGNVSRYPDNFLVRWTLPQDNGKPIKKFDLRYFQVEPVANNEWRSVGKDTTVEINEWSSGARYQIAGLKPNSYYKVELRAYNEIGFSQHASMVFQTAVGSTREEHQGLQEGGGILTTPAIVAIVIVVVLVVLGLLDVTCYLRNQCGLLYCLRTGICGRSPASDKAKEAVEDGKGRARPHHYGDGQLPSEDTPMIDSVGAKDTKSVDANSEEYKNKSPKGSKSSIAKDSLV